MQGVFRTKVLGGGGEGDNFNLTRGAEQLVSLPCSLCGMGVVPETTERTLD